MAVQDSTSGLSLLPLMKVSPIAKVVHASFNSLVLVYHSLETTSSVTVEQKLGKDMHFMMLTLCGMGRAVAQIMSVVPSISHRGSVQNLINILQMTLRYDCVLMSIQVMKIFQLRSLNSIYSKYRMTCFEPLAVSLTNTNLYMYLLLRNFLQNAGIYEPTGIVAAVVYHTMLLSLHSHVYTGTCASG